jgi:rSAM/selenodomain-associated transferase 1
MRQVTETVVALFVRAPVPGRVKTRLAVGLGEEGACQLYQAMVADILGTLKTSGLPIHLFHDDKDWGALPQVWRDAATQVRPQRGADIGERMAAAFADSFAQEIEQVILVGSDIPDLDAGIIGAAREALATHDAALAPAVDGGYGLIALKRQQYRPQLFTDIPWSTGQVLPTTLQRFAACRLNAALLPLLRDIDTLADLLAYRHHPCPSAPATNQAIVQLLAQAGFGREHEPHR